METTFSEDKNPGNTYVAFFDIDRTITREISGNSLVIAAYRKGLMSSSDLARASYFSIVYKLNLIDPLIIIENMVTWVKGMTERMLSDLCDEVFHKVLLPSVYSEARSEIDFHKGKNGKVVILSSALTPICREIAKNLGMDDIICTDLEIKDGIFTGSSLRRPCFGEEKKIRLNEYCEKNNTNTSDAWYYADSISDLPALGIVGNAICVNPDKKLKKTALKRDWKILNWHN
jgi:HAD superfamily hydrolase (TIGR01490 family)